jgi:hypothetical protein
MCCVEITLCSNPNGICANSMYKRDFYLRLHTAGLLPEASLRPVRVLLAFSAPKTIAALCAPHRSTSDSSEPEKGNFEIQLKFRHSAHYLVGN